MYAHGAAAQKDVEASEAAQIAAQAEKDRAEAKLANYGGNETSRKDDFIMRSPLSGTLVEKNITPGQEIRSDLMLANAPQFTDPQFIVTDPTKLWLFLDVDELTVTSLAVGRDVAIHTAAYPGKVFTGKIDKVFHVMDADSKVQNVRIVIENPDFLLRPEMQASIIVKHPDLKKEIAIADDAVIFDKSRYYVLMYGGNCNISIREVEILDFIDSKVYIKNGLSDGDIILRGFVNPIYSGLNY